MKCLKRLFAKIFGTDEEVSFVTMAITLLPVFVLSFLPFVIWNELTETAKSLIKQFMVGMFS